jgi:hypothetical protein
MYWQHEYLREGATMTRSQTYRIDLPKTGQLSGILLKVTAPSVSAAFANGGDWRLLDYLGLIEVIGNGATVIKSLQAKNLHFTAWLHQGIVTPHFWRNYATNTQFEYILILFGRYLFDTDYGLDLGKWDNVELRVTNTATASTHGSDPTVSIVQYFLRQNPGSFRGYIRSEIWREWTTVTDETKYFVLPTEFPISGIYLRALPATTTGMSDTGMSNLMDDVDFSIQGGTLQLFKGGIDDLIVSNYLDRGAEIITSGEWYGNADKGIDVSVGRMFGWAGVWGAKGGAAATVDQTMIADATDNTISFEGAQADEVAEFITRGLAFHNHGYLLHNHLLVPDFMIDPKRDGEVRLNIHTANSATADNGTNQVVLERLVSG